MKLERKMKVQNWKKQEVSEIVKLLEEYPIIGIIDGTSLPSMQLQKMRFKLKPEVLIKMTKSRLLKLALEQVKVKKPGIESLEKYIKYNIPILLFSREDSFRLSKKLIKNRSAAPAKPGQIAPYDLIISAGPTEFTPGPIIGELGQAGLKTAVEGGKIAIKEDKVVAREGAVITDKIASILAKLGIQPMKIGINLLATYDRGMIFEKKVLDIDEEQYINNIKLAASHAFNLAFKIEFPTKENIKLLIKKAELESLVLESKVDMEKIKSLESKHEVKEEKKVEEPKHEHKHEEPKIIEEKHEVKEHHHEEVKVEQSKQAHNPQEKFDEASKKAQDLLTDLQNKKIAKRVY